MVDAFREALDKQAPALVAATVRSFTAPTPTLPPRPRKTEAVTVRTSSRQFESWLKGISQISDVGDAKRLRSDVAGQIRRAKSLTGAPLPLFSLAFFSLYMLTHASP
jgi:sorting nexin-25